MLSAGLLTGVILGLRLGLEFELTLDPAEPVTADVAQFGISTFAAATATGISTLASYAPLRSLPAAGLAGGVGWAVYGALTLLAEFGPVVATGVAATVVGVASGLFRRGTGTRALDHSVRDHPAAARAHRISRLLPAGHAERGGRPGHHDARAGHRPRPRRRRGARRLHRRPRAARNVKQPDAKPSA